MKQSRVMTAAVSSGSGKTLITCGLLSFLKDRGISVSSFKCGPDYIDPMFHRRVLGIPGGNLDSFFAGEAEIRRMIADADTDASVIEGVMGIYDGVSVKCSKAASDSGVRKASAGTAAAGSCYEIARITDTPIILIVNVKGMGQTMISVIKGVLADDDECLIRGIVLNRISRNYYETVRPGLEAVLEGISEGRGAGVYLLGGLPDAEDIKLESRHLGLMLPHEIDDLHDQIKRAEQLIADNLDTERLLDIMSEAGIPGEVSVREAGEAAGTDAGTAADSAADSGFDGPVLAAARDEAFCFYYEENLRFVESCGIRIREFSPLHDSCVPDDADGLLLGGGYPELYAEALSSNTGMMDSIRAALSGGMPSLAECGGFMYLLDGIQDQNGSMLPMAGLVPGTAANSGRLGRFGYITVTGDCRDDRPDLNYKAAETLISGLSVRGHEFHYYDSDNNGTDALAVKAGSGRTWQCMHAGPEHLWGYPHLYYPSCPELIRRFRSVMLRYRDKRGKRHG